MKDSEITDGQLAIICSSVIQLTMHKLQQTPDLDIPAFSARLLSELIDAIELRQYQEETNEQNILNN